MEYLSSVFQIFGRFLVSMIRETYAFMIAHVCMCVCTCVYVCVCDTLLVNTISQEGDFWSGVTRGQNLKTLLTRYLKLENLYRFQTWYVDVLWLEGGPYYFWWKSKVIWGQQGSKPENIVYTISWDRKLGWMSYLVCRYIVVRERTLVFLVGVKGHLGSAGVKHWKPC